METTQAKNGKNGTKPRWKRPKEKKKYTADEMELIKTSFAVLEVIREQKKRGDFDEYLEEESLRK